MLSRFGQSASHGAISRSSAARFCSSSPQITWRVTSVSASAPASKLTAWGVRANWRSRPVAVTSVSSSIATTSSPASPDGFKRLVSKTKTSRSLLPARPRVTSVAMRPHVSPRTSRTRRRALRSSPASSIATTSKREMTSAMQRRSKRSRRGESSCSERHFSVTRPKARRFQVATRRLRSRCRGGIVSSRATTSRPKTSARSCGSGSVISAVVPSLC